MRSILSAIVLLAALAAPNIAEAQNASVQLQGEVLPICELTGEGFTGLPNTIQRTVNLSNPQSLPNVNLNMSLTCTQSFTIGFIPQYARFENINASPGSLQDPSVGDGYFFNGSLVPNFVGALKYTINATLGGITLPSGGGGPSYVSPGFGPGSGFFTSPLSPRTAALVVTFNPVEIPAATHLLAGAYRERLTIQITPQGL